MTPELRATVRLVVDAAVTWRHAQTTPRSWMAPETVVLADAVDHLLAAVAKAREHCTMECEDGHCENYGSSEPGLQELCSRERARARSMARSSGVPEEMVAPPSRVHLVAGDLVSRTEQPAEPIPQDG